MKDKVVPINGIRIRVRITPNAPRNQVTGLRNDTYLVKINAPPVEGKANKALIEFLSELLDISKSSITILKGQTSRDKVLLIFGISQPELAQRLAKVIKS